MTTIQEAPRPRFSVITVCRNSAKVLPAAMASLAGQSFRNYEWIVVDGASTDGTRQIAESFTAAHMQIISEPDAGIYDAMNKGIRMASGEYLFFLNSDDRLFDSNVLDNVNDDLVKRSSPDFLFGKVVNVRADGNWLRDYSHVHRRNVVEEGICHQAIFAHWQLFRTVGAFNTLFRLNADYDWIIRVYRAKARCVSVDRCVAYFMDGGAHAVDKVGLAREREAVRVQYVSRPLLQLRLIWNRVVGRVYRTVHGHRRGITLLPPTVRE